ncbi:MAG: radical SAM-associated putative lipoprotein [Bacteroidales bacterium]|nr:radical SAM-associated putative lipoprotein [Bacteroidales bacterium]
MKQKARQLFRWILTSMLGLLGFSGCEWLNIGGGMVMYGQPHTDFQASGKVTDRSGNAIEGIRVSIRQHRHYANTPNVIYDQNDWYYDDTLYTDAAGRYELKTGITSFNGPDDVTVVFEDVDGEKNGGVFESQTVTPRVKQTAKAKDWYGGAYSVEADAQLEKK